ncbi:MAG: hypothetical protein HZA95_04170 [Candidatus Vogelbacteria bacterium]|nr:hypothetical protein [Candidatus Vogelbacteria bacterium]
MLKGIIRAEGLAIVRGAVERVLQSPAEEIGLRVSADETVCAGEAGRETLMGNTSFVKVIEGDEVHITPVARDVMAANMEALLAVEGMLGDGEACFAWTDKSMRFHWDGITQPIEILFPRPNQLMRSQMKLTSKRAAPAAGFAPNFAFGYNTNRS